MSFDTLNNALELVEGYNGKHFLGKVTQNVDPLNLDRIQASIPDMYDPDLGDVPWIGPIKFSPFGIGTGYGIYGTPAIGSDVLILLQEGDPQYPLYMSIQLTANDAFPSGTSWGFADPAGNTLNVQGSVVSFTSASGVTINIDDAGKVTINAPSDVDLTAATVNITAPVNITGDVTVTGKVAASADITSAANITASGNVADAGGGKTMAGMRSAFNSHTHIDSRGGTTSAPTSGV